MADWLRAKAASSAYVSFNSSPNSSKRAEAWSVFAACFFMRPSRAARCLLLVASCSSQNCFSVTSLFCSDSNLTIMSLNRPLTFPKMSSPVRPPKRITASMLVASCARVEDSCRNASRLTRLVALSGSDDCCAPSIMSMDPPPAIEANDFSAPAMAFSAWPRAFAAASRSPTVREQYLLALSAYSDALLRSLAEEARSSSACAFRCSMEALDPTRSEKADLLSAVGSAPAKDAISPASISASLAAFATRASNSRFRLSASLTSLRALFKVSLHHASNFF
mmetsp:Transcript_126272/g.252272  ORF Transcript_126272/g.252272 Transcript_126272/m.252272 type:complete len:279 (+) Transcript_126272:1235-2071(+)